MKRQRLCTSPRLNKSKGDNSNSFTNMRKSFLPFKKVRLSHKFKRFKLKNVRKSGGGVVSE